MAASRRPVYEGDTILLSCMDGDARGFVYALPPCSEYSCAVIKNEKERPNVHAISFQVLPEYAQHDSDSSSSPLTVTKEEARHYLHRKLVYGRKIKLLHVASNMYFSIPDKALKETETKPGFLSNEPYLFKMLPPLSVTTSSRGQDIYPGDEIILETVSRKGHHVLCAKNSLTNCFELKMAITNSIFAIKLQTKSDESVSPNVIRGGSIIRFYNTTTDSYLCAKGSTVHSVLPAADFEHDKEQKVYFKKKKVLPVPRPPPVSGDCWWQLVKQDGVYDGGSIESGGKCFLRHLPTHMYLIVTGDDFNLTIGSIDGLDPKYYTFTLINSVPAADNCILKGSSVSLVHEGIDDKKRHLNVDDGKWNWLTASNTKKGSCSKGLEVSLSDTVHAGNSFKIDEVRPDLVHLLYYVENVKNVLLRYYPKVVHDDPVLVELTDVLKKLVSWFKNNSPDNLKTCGKMLRNAHVIDLLIACVSIDVDVNEARDEERVKLVQGVSKVLREFLLIKSRHSHFYMAKKTFMKIYCTKLGLGLGVESFLITLVKDESEIAKDLVNFFIEIIKGSSSLEIHLDTASLNLLSTLCFVDGHPEEALQDLICEEIIQKDLGIFYHTCLEDGTSNINYSKSQLPTSVARPITDLCSNKVKDDDKDLNFFVAQIFLFSNVCKGVNKSAIETVSSWFPFQEALVILDKERLGGSIHPKVKSGYLQLVLSVYLEEVIQNSGVDIDSIWHCFLWERLSNPSNKSLHGANIKPNLLDKDDMKYKQEVPELLEILEKEVKDEDNYVHFEYLHQILAVMELMSLYGYCWNVGEAKKYISIYSIVNILERKVPVNVEKAADHKLKIRAINILNVFFKQFIYLSLERLLYDFRYRKDHTSNGSYLKPMIDGVVTEDTLKSVPRLREAVTSRQAPQTSFYESVSKEFFSFFNFNEYEYFNVETSNGQTLLSILIELMSSYNDQQLKCTAATLLFNIYRKEDLMLSSAQLSYIDIGEPVDGGIPPAGTEINHDVYFDMTRYGTYTDDHKIFLHMMQGTLKKNDDDGKYVTVLNILGILPCVLRLDDDETETKTTSQDIAFTAGVFSVLMCYILKFCPLRNNSSETQRPFIKGSCCVLQSICRNNEKVQLEIYESLTDLLRVKTGVSAVARLITEVFTKSPVLSHRLTEHDIELIYTLASTLMVGDNDVSADPEGPGYLEFLTTLEAIIKPFKSTGAAVKLHQRSVMKLFCANYVDHFGKIIMKDNENDEEKSSELRLRVLRNDAVDFELLKLLHVTSLLSFCCDGQVKTVEVVCREIFTLDELINILVDGDIVPVRKIPFARMLVGSYLSTERESIVSLHLLSNKHDFWGHVFRTAEDISNILCTLEKDEDDRVKTKYYFRKVFEYYETWDQVLNPRGPNEGLGLDEDDEPDDDDIISESLKESLFLLRYFVEGLGPILKSFCRELASYKGQKLTDKIYQYMITKELDHIDQSIENILQWLGPILISLFNIKDNIFITSDSQFKYWISIVEAIDGVYLQSRNYKDQLPTEDQVVFKSEDMMDYETEFEPQFKIMKEFYRFVSNYRFVYEWRKPSGTTPPEDLRSSDGLIPKGPSFQQLINLFSGGTPSPEGGVATAARRVIVPAADGKIVPVICDDKPLAGLLNVLDSQLRQQVASKERSRLHFTLLTTLQILFGITFKKIEEIDNCEWTDSTCSTDHQTYVKNLQNKFVLLKGWRYPDLVLKHMSNPDMKICVQIMGFLYTLVFNGNEDTQNDICNTIACNSNFFLSIYKLISVILQYSHIPKDFLVTRPVGPPSPSGDTVSQDTGGGTMVTGGGTMVTGGGTTVTGGGTTVTGGDTILPMDTLTGPGQGLEETDALLATPPHTSVSLDTAITSFTSYPSVYKPTEGFDVTGLHQVGVGLDLISSLCDGQNRKLQAIMKEQDNSFNINVISGTAALLETLAEVRQDTINENESVLLTGIMTKAIQCLIEMCAGNFSNQSAALDGQILDSINMIIKESCPKEDGTTGIPVIVEVPVHVLGMQCKAVELLHVLLEETDKDLSPGLVKAISKDLKKKRLMYFVKAVHARIEDIDETKVQLIRRNMFRAYHVLKSLAEDSELSFEEFIELKKTKPPIEEPVHVTRKKRSRVANDNQNKCKDCKILLEDSNNEYCTICKELNDIRTLCNELDKDTHRIEINYITKDKKWILTPVYFPFESSRCMNNGEKIILQANISRDSVEDKAKDLSNWSKSFLKKDEYKRKLEKHNIWKVVTFLSTLRQWSLIFLTIFLNIFVLGIYQIPSYNCEFDANVTVNGLLLIPHPWRCWSIYQYVILYFFGVIHIALSLWMVVEYFVCEKSNFLYEVPLIKAFVNSVKECIRNDIPFLSKRFKWINTEEKSEDSECFDIYFFSFSPIYRIIFLLSSILSIGTFGYFYCLCLPYIFLKIDVMQDIVKAISRRSKQLFLMACFILSLLLIYAVLSFAIMSSFFDPKENNQFCTTLWECYVTVIREGLLDGFGAIAVTYAGQNGANFDVYLWRAVFDLIFFVVISTISLEVITAILVDTFSELRQEKDKAENDQKSVCFVCGIENDEFERRGKGFAKHYHNDHNLYSYIYFILHIKSMSSHDHNAIEKYVNDKFDNDEIDFYPLHKAKVLGGLVMKKKDVKTMIDELLVNT